MLRNHIIFALRIFWKDKVYSILNLLGLTLGISVGIILMLYLQNELSYDKHHDKADRIYRFTNHLKATGADFNTAYTARELAPIMKDELPFILNYVRFNPYSNTMVSIGDEDTKDPVKFYEDGIMVTDSSFLSVFTHDVLAGDPSKCLVGPDKVVLTESIAKKYFGDGEAVGKIISIDGVEERKITAVISDLPHNSHLKYTILLSGMTNRSWYDGETDPMNKSEAMWNPGIFTYFLVPASYDPGDFEEQFEVIFEKYFRPFADRINGSATPKLQALPNIHFNSTAGDDLPTGDKAYIYAFTTIGLFLILLACINYMNLATARSVYRVSEMGVRKVLGNTRAKLFRSILLEAIVLSALAMILAIIICYITLEFTAFNDWIDKQLSLDFIDNQLLLIGVIGITLLVGLVSGIYPAIYIPAVPVVAALKGSYIGQGKGILMRKVLIVLQFVVSIFVIVTTVMMDRQIDYMRDVELGFNPENVVLVDIRTREMENKMDAIRNELSKDPNVISSASAYGVPGIDVGGQVFLVEKEGELTQQSMACIYPGDNYLETVGFEIVSGRGFLDRESSLNKEFLINESGAKEMGWTNESAVGRRVRYFHGEHDMKVVGVVKDFNFESLHRKIRPLFILPSDRQGGTLHVRVKNHDLQETLSHIEEVYTRFDQKNPFDYKFMDIEFDKQYAQDQIQHKLLATLSYICIFISVLGLIGLSAFTVGQKAKEISIRKTLGASVFNVMALFSKGYVKLIVLAAVIAVPMADFLIVEWLSEFAYKMPINWVYYILPVMLVLLFGMFTVSFHVIKAAKANPVDGLRSE